MKKTLLTLTAIAGLLVACNKDDDDTPAPVTPAVTSTTYKFTALNSSVQTDLNGDGTPHTNQLEETHCFDNMLIVLRSDHTFTANSKGVDIDSETNPATLACFTDPDYTGTWSQSDNEIMLHYVDTTATPNETYDDFYEVSADGNTLSATVTAMDGGQVVGTSGGVPTYLDSDLEFVYTKQ